MTLRLCVPGLKAAYGEAFGRGAEAPRFHRFHFATFRGELDAANIPQSSVSDGRVK
jgi:hypothetical protein